MTASILSQRGQTELLSYVIIAGVVFSILGFTLFVGLPAFSHAQSQAESQAMERTFAQLDATADRAHHGTPLDYTMAIPPGTLNTQGNATYINISASHSGTTVRDVSVKMLSVTYEPDAEVDTIIYDGGLIAARSPASPQNPRLIAHPAHSQTTTSTTSSVQLNSFQTITTDAIDGPATLNYQVVAPPARATTTRVFTPNASTTVTIRIDSPHTASWQAFLETLPAVTNVQTTSTPDGPVLEATVPTGNRFTITAVPIELRQQS